VPWIATRPLLEGGVVRPEHCIPERRAVFTPRRLKGDRLDTIRVIFIRRSSVRDQGLNTWHLGEAGGKETAMRQIFVFTVRKIAFVPHEQDG
jgi:hypothetical protein